MTDVSRLVDSPQPPIYTHRTRYSTVLAYLAVVALVPIASVMDIPFAWLITPAFFFATIMFVGIIGDQDAKVKEKYANQLRAAYVSNGSVAADDDSLRQIAEKNVRKSALSIVLSIAVFCYLSVAFSYNASSDWIEVSSLKDFLLNAGIVVVAAVWVFLSLFSAFVLLAISNRSDADFSLIMDGMKSPIHSVILPHDRNDLEIVGLSVQSQTLNRRVDAYTLESTLLSALAFSAFISMVFSDKGPNIGNRLTTQSKSYCPPFDWTPGNFCIPYVTLPDISESLMYYICAPLLVCSISFLAVLVTRLRFSDAIHYTEQTIRTAEKLNEKENQLPDGDSKIAYTAEIDRLMMRARAGFSDISPMLGFMKIFRDIGILSFIVSIGMCGFVYNPWIALIILVVFMGAFVYGVMDTHRRKSFFLPLLEATVISFNRRVSR